MKNTGLLLLLTVFGIFFITSCDKEDLDINESYVQNYKGNKDQKKSKKPKVEICHFDKKSQSYVKLSISENGLKGHANHTDDIINFDKDGDGFPVMNECGINFREDGLFDCDDEDDEKYPMDMDEDGFTACDDCDDNDSNLNPNTVWYADSDGDGYGDPKSSVTSCEKSDAYVLDNTDLNDADATITDVEPVTFSYVQGDAIYNKNLGCVFSPNSNTIYINEIPTPTQLNFNVDGQVINAMSLDNGNSFVHNVLAHGSTGYWYYLQGNQGGPVLELNQSKTGQDPMQGDAKITLTNISGGTVNITLDINYLYKHTDGNTYPVSLSYPLEYTYQSIGNCYEEEEEEESCNNEFPFYRSLIGTYSFNVPGVNETLVFEIIDFYESNYNVDPGEESEGSECSISGSADLPRLKDNFDGTFSYNGMVGISFYFPQPTLDLTFDIPVQRGWTDTYKSRLSLDDGLTYIESPSGIRIPLLKQP